MPCGCGIPLGNLTSQLFSNIYLNSLDQFIKRELKSKCYIRYADDFVILSCDKTHLENLIPKIKKFLSLILKLKLHPDKVVLCKWNQGIDFLGYVIFPHHIILRTKTKKRMMRKIEYNYQLLRKGLINETDYNQSLQSYLGLLRHCRGKTIQKQIEEIIGKSFG